MENYAKVELLKASEAINLQRYDLAIQCIQNVLRDFPEEEHAFYLMARAHAGNEAYDSAFQAIQEAIRIDPLEADYHYYLGFLYYKTKKFKQAIKVLQHVLSIDPDHLGTHLLFGHIFLSKRKKKKALIHIQRAMELDPTNPDCHSLMAFGLGQVGKIRQGKETLQTVLNLEPDNVDSQHAYGIFLLYYMHKPKEALVHLQEAIRLDPNDPEVLEDYLEAIKAKNWFYYLFWRVALWNGRLGKWRFLLIPFLAVIVGICSLLWYAFPMIGMYIDQFLGIYAVTYIGEFLGLLFAAIGFVTAVGGYLLVIINLLSWIVHPLFHLLAKKDS
ncbi:tetratricopeptide repeat protein [Risungbinella massiliensis]|uniref:tetratricopeptide repeat protein n=1 Tax=Risungbinella massiliensis TaxID=1329796 RepID=UPI0005CBAD8B|nr:tetratricopeptide repeat protein [Risungbinella massiliensis]